MEELQKLVKLLDKKGFESSPLIDQSENTLEARFYALIKSNELSEDAAMVALYGSSNKKEAFKMLKSRFKKKLYHQLYFLSHDSFTALVSAEINFNKLLGEANLLYRSLEYKLAEKRILQAIKQAKQFCLTNEIVLGLELYQKILIDSYYNKSKYEKCVAELEAQYQILSYEREATRIYNEVFINLSAGIDSRYTISTKISELLFTMEQLWSMTESPKIFKQFYKVKMGYFELTGKYNEQIDFIKKTAALYQIGQINPNYFSLVFSNYVLSYACLRAGNFEEGIQATEDALAQTVGKTNNWFATLENYYLLNLHSRKYEKALSIIKEVFSHSFFVNLDDVVKERWLLFAHYLKLVHGNVLKLSDWRVNVINKDKKGFNIWLLILDFLTNVKQGKHDQLFREAERIRKYMSKHLKSKADPRYKLFLKLLLLVVKEEFDETSIKLKSRYMVKKLEQTPPAGDAYAEIEIVPFEHLWEFILHSLATTKVKV